MAHPSHALTQKTEKLGSVKEISEAIEILTKGQTMIISALSSQGNRMDRCFDGLESGIKQVDERLEGVERKITGLVFRL